MPGKELKGRQYPVVTKFFLYSDDLELYKFK